MNSLSHAVRTIRASLAELPSCQESLFSTMHKLTPDKVEAGNEGLLSCHAVKRACSEQCTSSLQMGLGQGMKLDVSH